MKVEAIYMDIKLLKKLREETGAGMLEYKASGAVHNVIMKKHYPTLNHQSKLKIQTTRVASKGIIKGNQAILFEVNAETDFCFKKMNTSSIYSTN